MRFSEWARLPLQSRYNIANRVAASLAAFAAGIELDDMRGGLRTFHATPFQTPGRANLYEFRDFRVMIDYCHNAHAMKQVGPFLQAMKKARLIAVLNARCDHGPEDFDAMRRAAAPFFDRVVLRDDEDLRGREPGEVAGHLRAALLAGGLKPEQVETVKNEAEAVRRALGLAGRDDLVVVFADRIAKVAALVDFERQKEVRA